jgi:porin
MRNHIFLRQKLGAPNLMSKLNILFGIGILLGLIGICRAENEESRGEDLLSNSGVEIDLGVTNIYQHNLRGGISTHRRAGRYSGSYDLELSANMQKLLGAEGLNFYMLAEGSWPDTTGIDGTSVGSFFGINEDAAGDRAVDVTELWFEQAFLDGTFLLRLGKIDLTGGFECHDCPVAFDSSSYANDETSQFLNGALVNNPTMPFPDNGLGVAFFYEFIDFWYLSAAAADAQSDIRETGFNTAFRNEDYFFYIFETGITPQFNSANGLLQGAYRTGLWYDPQPKAHSDTAKNYRDDIGFYLSCDQLLAKENADPEDNQGLGAFLRYGYANSKKNDIANFLSAGFQYQGLIQNCDDDVFAVGFAHGVFSDRASSTYPEDYESAVELYYNAQLSPWLSITPSLQYIANPGGAKGVGDALVFGLRLQMRF